MPVITCVLIEGYCEQTRRLLEERLTDAARSATGAPWDGITVMINELPDANYMRGRIERIPAKAPVQPAQLVQQFLNAMEARNLAKAKSCLAERFTMLFPGGVEFTKLEQMIEWAKPRYQSIIKTYEKFDEAFDKDGAAVYCFGTLSGKWLDGTSFEGIRFVDRFRVVDEKLTSQRVWNDLAEVGA
jgi:phenylpyruvate tautomerase PptA (4-oxalocrotonate tautomerase family)